MSSKEYGTFTQIMHVRHIISYCFLLGFIIFSQVSLKGQVEVSTENEAAQSTLREEVERYFGYEDLTYRYVTLPYDVGANVNLQGNFVDIGYLLFAIGPLCLLGFLYKSKKLFYGFMLLLLVYISLCFRFSHLKDQDYVAYNPISTDVTFVNASWEGTLLHPVYEIAGMISYPLVSFLDLFTGDRDHVTYPLVIGMYLVLLFLLLRSDAIRHSTKVIGVIGFSFAFIWSILSGGIIWYGYLMIPVGFLFIFHSINSKRPGFKLPLRTLLLSTAASWMVLSLVLRISNINSVTYQLDPSMADHGKLIVEPRIFPYSIGVQDSNETIDKLSPNITTALDHLNQNEELIYQAGSSLNFEIKRNDKRIFEDNTLTYFYNIAEKYRSRDAITERLKKLGFRYIIFDPLTPSLDKTPEKSLTKKYRAFVNLLLNNSRIKLLATDQVVQVQKNGAPTSEFGFFGDRITKFGTYAVFEII